MDYPMMPVAFYPSQMLLLFPLVTKIKLCFPQKPTLNSYYPTITPKPLYLILHFPGRHSSQVILIGEEF